MERRKEPALLRVLQNTAMPMTVHIGFPVFPDLTQLDFTGPWEVLTRLPHTQCHVLSHDLSPVKSKSGLSFLPTLAFAAAPPLDILCVPGGPGTLHAMTDDKLLAFLRRQAPHCRYVTAVCTGSLVLAAAGLLQGYRATSHWQSIDRLAAFGAIPVKERLVIDRDRITGGGVTAGIDFALHLAALLAGEETARLIALQIEYAPVPPFPGDPATADPALIEKLNARLGGYRAEMARADAAALENLRAQRR